MKQIEVLLPEIYRQQLHPQDWEGMEEIRLGSGRPMRLRYAKMERELWPKLQPHMVEGVIQRACHHSAYAYTESIRRGYVTIEGGHRIGICGCGVLDKGIVGTIKEPSSLNIRIARQVYGCAVLLAAQLQDSALLLGPPGSGKTTLLRDTVRLLSDQRRQIVGLVDERGELSASTGGISQLDIGTRTDVLVNIPKAEAVMMLLRTMNPTWIALDEITAAEDIMAIEQAAYCGVKLLATAHGHGVDDLRKRPLYRKLMETGVFRQLVVLRSDKSYTIEEAER